MQIQNRKILFVHPHSGDRESWTMSWNVIIHTVIVPCWNQNEKCSCWIPRLSSWNIYLHEIFTIFPSFSWCNGSDIYPSFDITIWFIIVNCCIPSVTGGYSWKIIHVVFIGLGFVWLRIYYRNSSEKELFLLNWS